MTDLFSDEATEPGRPTKATKLAFAAMDIEARTATDAGTFGLMARSLALASLPHGPSTSLYYERSNGDLRISISGDPHYGLPYGTKPRLIIAWLTSEAHRSKGREIALGDSFAQFLRYLGIEQATGGKRGTLTSIRTQLLRLLNASIRVVYDDKKTAFKLQRCDIADQAELWWDTKNPHQLGLSKSYIYLSENFYNEVRDRPIPIDLRAINVLRGSSMAIDIYCWLTYRFSYLRKPTPIPWAFLQMQFGAGYPFGDDDKAAQGERDFRKKFHYHLAQVLIVYREAHISVETEYVWLYPSMTHVRKRS